MRKLAVTEMGRLTPEEFAAADKAPLAVVLDNVRSAYNVGAVLRTADAFRVEKAFMCGITACPPSAEIHKTALGAEDTVEWEYRPDTAVAVAELVSQGYTVFAVEQAEGSEMLQSFTPPEGKCAIVLGNEVKGVSQQVVDMCAGCIEIPQFGTKHSLNVSVAAGIVMWHITQLRPAQPR